MYHCECPGSAATFRIQRLCSTIPALSQFETAPSQAVIAAACRLSLDHLLVVNRTVNALA
jgi:hypothetical protein